MPWSLDARIPVRLGTSADVTPDDALLIEGNLPSSQPNPAQHFDPAPAAPVTLHVQGCACCIPRNPAALALDRLFQRRARGETPFFRRVLALTTTPEGDLAVWTALRTDPLASTRYRTAAV